MLWYWYCNITKCNGFILFFLCLGMWVIFRFGLKAQWGSCTQRPCAVNADQSNRPPLCFFLRIPHCMIIRLSQQSLVLNTVSANRDVFKSECFTLVQRFDQCPLPWNRLCELGEQSYHSYLSWYHYKQLGVHSLCTLLQHTLSTCAQ